MKSKTLNDLTLGLSIVSLTIFTFFSIAFWSIPEFQHKQILFLCLVFTSVPIALIINSQRKWNIIKKHLQTIIDEKTSLKLNFDNMITPSNQNPEYAFVYFKIEGLQIKATLKLKTDSLSISHQNILWSDIPSKLESRELDFLLD